MIGRFCFYIIRLDISFIYFVISFLKIRFYMRRTSQLTRNISQAAESSVVDKGSLWTSMIGEVVVFDVKNGEISYQVNCCF